MSATNTADLEMFCTDCKVFRDPSLATKVEFIKTHQGHPITWRRPK